MLNPTTLAAPSNSSNSSLYLSTTCTEIIISFVLEYRVKTNQTYSKKGGLLDSFLTLYTENYPQTDARPK